MIPNGPIKKKLIQTQKTLFVKKGLIEQYDKTKIRDNSKDRLERAVDGAPSQIPTLKFLTPQVPSPGHDLGNRMKILFNMFSIFYL